MRVHPTQVINKYLIYREILRGNQHCKSWTGRNVAKSELTENLRFPSNKPYSNYESPMKSNSTNEDVGWILAHTTLSKETSPIQPLGFWRRWRHGHNWRAPIDIKIKITAWICYSKFYCTSPVNALKFWPIQNDPWGLVHYTVSDIHSLLLPRRADSECT